MLPRNVQTSLLATQLVAVATLARSVAYGFWFTVVVSALMAIGALAAARHRTWGVALSFATASTFAVAAMLGIAPPWFLFVGAIGATPFLLTSEALRKADHQATALLAGLAAGTGAALAAAWSVVAWSVFLTFPFLAPTRFIANGVGAAVVLVLGSMVAFAHRPRGARLRIAEPDRLRIGDVHEAQASTAHDEEAEAEAHEEALAAARRS